ncbi:hypothetical protein [Niallia sp. Krafla_26]|uniref:hypothetical protein n=1 Tax=Niallia sp. Krafla_26 TaxID=3064703 RepID=UPI003D17DDB7
MKVISSKLFSQMQSYKTFESSQKERRQMKYNFIDRIKDNVSIRWNRAKKLLSVIDEIIYKATDRGYSFNGRETLAELCKVGLSTIDKAIRVLKESGEVIVVYRENPNSNGCKTPVIILKNHPHFKYWNELLNLEQNLEQKVENAKIPTDSRDEQPQKVSTYLLPKKQENNINKVVRYVSNKIMDVVNKGITINYLSSYVDTVVRSEERKALYYENMRLEKAKQQQEQERSRLAVKLGIVPKRVKLEDVYYDYYKE